MSKIWSKEETLWSFALYGTAVGAGTLFLPIQLGSAGAIVLFLTALVAAVNLLAAQSAVSIHPVGQSGGR